MRSVLSAAGLVTLAALLLAACGPSPNPTPSTSPAITPSASVSPVASSSVSASASAEARPNVILIVLDDLDVATLAGVPELANRLSDGGTTFTNAYVTDPRCCPSRVSILTGQYLHNHGVLTNSLPDGGFLRFHADGGEASTLATWLQAAGYRTALLGKYLNDYPAPPDVTLTYVPPGWDVWHAVAGDLNYYDYGIHEDGTVVTHGSAEEDYLTDVLAEHAARVVESAAADEVPLFLMLTPYAPHAPSTPAPRHLDSFPGALAPRGPAFNEGDLSDKPSWMQGLRPLQEVHEARFDELYRARFQTMLAVSDLLDRLDQALATAGIADDTYLIFTSDNGFHAGQHRLPAGKATPYEEDIRVPLIISGPAAAPGSIIDAPISLVDLAPTILELAGAEASGELDGRSLLPLLAAPATIPDEWRTAVLVEHGGPDLAGSARTPPFAAVRTATELYAEYADGDRELYDLTTDPFQLENVIDGADPNQLATFAAILEALSTCGGASCLAADRPD